MDVKLNNTDPSQNFIGRQSHPLDALFLPKSIAIIGAKDDKGSVGRTIMQNIIAGGTLKDNIYPINPKRSEVMGLKSYPTILDVPKPVDLAVFVTPAATVPALVKQCTEAKVKSGIIISAGFKELGESGLKLEEEILSYAKQGNMRIIGPNCLGVMNPIYGLNATFAKGMALKGNIAFISQSGAMCTSVLDWSFAENIGFSAFVSVGSMADVDWGTLIDYLGDDPHTHSLLLYMETVGDARSFLTAAREVALEKPIIVIKAGRSQEAAQAAASHTGSLSGSDEVFDAALERVGVLRVHSIGDLFNMASVLSRQPRPKGPYLSIITNAGGPAVLATDSVVINHAKMTQLDETSIQELDTFLPAAWSHGNPIDILGDAQAGRYTKAIKVIMEDSKTDGLLVILSPQDVTDSTGTAESIKEFGKNSKKPILASWMGEQTVREGIKILSEASIPNFSYPDDAARIFSAMWRYSQNIQSLYETALLEYPHSLEYGKGVVEGRIKKTKKLIEGVLTENRTLLTEYESKQILHHYHIPVVLTRVAKTVEECLELAERIGFPIVLKLYSHTITHKTDVGGVKLNLVSPDDVIKAFNEIYNSIIKAYGEDSFEGVTVQPMVKMAGYELILGSTTDPQFGPVLLFGLGGQLVEIFKDRALALPPLTRNLAQRMMKKTKIFEALLGVRGRKAVNLEELEDVLVHFSQMIAENPRIKECDINPLLVSDEGMVALDARIILHDKNIPDDKLPKLAIRPYPTEYMKEIFLKNATSIHLRPIRPEDESLLIEFHKELSENTVRQRYFEFVSLDDRVAHDRLIRICFSDYDREWVIVAEVKNHEKKQIAGIGRLFRIIGTNKAEFKLTIIDSFHNLGLGTEILKHLIHIAEKENIDPIEGFILSENIGMIKITTKLGFKVISKPHSTIVHVKRMIKEPCINA